METRKILLVIYFILLLTAFIVPYTALINIFRFFGAYFFWLIVTMIAIIIMFYITKKWE